MSSLEQAIALAAISHQGQKDKSGATYILHPLRVMMKMHTETEMIVAVLHDVIEDCGITLDDLRKQGFSEEVIQALDCVTRRRGESYKNFTSRSLTNPIARKVKIADLEDNMDLKRMKGFMWKDGIRLKRYHEAWLRLTQASKPTLPINIS
jgi:(p)ppGpp synthase/HD superfamily hydrolase